MPLAGGKLDHAGHVAKHGLGAVGKGIGDGGSGTAGGHDVIGQLDAVADGFIGDVGEGGFGRALARLDDQARGSHDQCGILREAGGSKEGKKGGEKGFLHSVNVAKMGRDVRNWLQEVPLVGSGKIAPG